MVNTFVFMGCPGSGKGKQAELLHEKTQFPVFSTGVKFREMAKEKTFVGRKIDKELNSGALLPDWLSEYLFQNLLLKLEESDGIILDGINRHETESREFSEICEWLGRDYRIININISEASITERLRKRYEIEGRKDDDPVVFQTRLKNFYKHTAPAIEYFRSINKVIDIDGEPLPDEVFEEVWQKISSL